MNKARITYRIDQSQTENRTGGESRQPQRVIPLYEEEFHVVPDKVPEGQEPAASQQTTSPFSPWRDPQAVNPYSNDYGAWEIPIETEADRVERAIRESEERRGYPQTGNRHENDSRVQQPGPVYESNRVYQTPETPVYEAPDVMYRSNSRQPNPPWLKLTVSVAGAALTGVILGFFVLQMFSINGKKDSQVQDILNQPAVDTLAKADPSAGTAGNVKPSDKPAAALASSIAGEAVNLPGRTFTFIQSGSFSTQQAAETAAADLQKKGYAAVVDKAEQYKVYMGMAQSRDKALGLSQQMKQQKMDVILKDYSIPAVNSVKWNGKPDTLKTYMTETDKLIGTISSLTLLHLEEAKLTPVDDTTMLSLKTAHESWTSASSAVGTAMPEEGKAALQKMNNAVNSAKKSLDEYKKSPSAPMLWQAQTYIMQCSLAEKDLLAALAVK